MAGSARKTGVWIVVGLLCLGMVSFGSSGFGLSIRSIGSVGDRDLPVQSYANALNDELQRLSRDFGVPLTMEQARAFGLDQIVLSRVVSDRAIDNMAGEMGLSIGDAAVAREVRNTDGFAGLDGEFDREVYRARLQQRGQTESEFEAEVRDSLTRRMVQIGVAGGLTAPPEMAQTLVAHARETRDVTWAAVTASALTAPLAEPTEADLQAFYDANPDRFTAPEERQITYAWLTPEMIQDSVIVDDQAVADLYQERIDEFVLPERRLVERLVFLDDAAASAALARVTADETDFDGLVAERGLQLSDVDLGDVGLEDLGDAGAAIFAAVPGDVVGPLPSALGPALFRMNAVLVAEETPFEEVEADLRAELANQRARRVIGDATEPVNDLLAGGATLEDLADNTDLELGTINWTPDMTDGIAAYDAFRAAAAAVTAEDDPRIGEFDDGGIFLIRLDGVTPPALRPFADVADDVRAGWTAVAQQTALLVEAERRAELIRAAGTFDTPGVDLIPLVEQGVARDGFLAGTPDGTVARVFAAAAGDVVVIDAGDSAVILQVVAVNAADPTDPAIIAETAALQGETTSGMAQDLYAAFTSAVLGGTDVQLDQAAIDAVLASFQ
jgi:peptidyl-prolyl cis-trans isomerase D